MSITNIDKNHLKQIIEIPNLNELNRDKIIKSVQKNSNNYAKIKVFKQMENIKKEIEEIIQESLETDDLNNIKCNFKKIRVLLFISKTRFYIIFFNIKSK